MATMANPIPILLSRLSFSLNIKTPVKVPSTITPMFTDAKTVDGWVDKTLSSPVEDILNTIKPDVRNLVELRYIENLPYIDIGNIAGLPPMRVRERVRNARNAMNKTVRKLKSVS